MWRRSAQADVTAQASRAVRVLLASSLRQARDLPRLQAMLAERTGPLPLLPGDAAALLHSLATGSMWSIMASSIGQNMTAPNAAAHACAAKGVEGSAQQTVVDLLATQVLRVDCRVELDAKDASLLYNSAERYAAFEVLCVRILRPVMVLALKCKPVSLLSGGCRTPNRPWHRSCTLQSPQTSRRCRPPRP